MLRFRSIFPMGAILYWGSFLLAGQPSLESVSPPIAQRGTEVELTFLGASIGETKEILFYRDGVTLLNVAPVSAESAVAKIKISTDAPLGAIPFRLRTEEGISELRTLTITPFQITNENRAEDKSPQSLTNLPTTVVGKLNEGNVDRYQVQCTEGDRLSVEVQAVRLGIQLLDTILTIRAPDSRVIASIDDTALFRQDPFYSLIAPQTGTYTIEVREANYEGDDSSWYALHIGNFARPTFAMPAGAEVAIKNKIILDGDALGPMEQVVQFDQPKKRLDELELIADNTSTPTPIPFRFTNHPNVSEFEPNDAPQDPRDEAADLPVAFNGTLERDGDHDHFRFRAIQGTRYRFEAFADRVGSSADTRISILDPSGTSIASNDDGVTHDSLLDFTAPTTGEYLLQVTDKLAEGSWDAIYRIEATPVQPELKTFLPRPNRLSQEGQAIAVPQGNRVLAKMGIQRLHFDGEVSCTWQELPLGVRGTPALIPHDRYWMPVVLEAHKKAPLNGRLSNFQGIFKYGETNVTGNFEQIIDLVGGPADALFHSTSVDKLAIAVTRPVPFSIDLDVPKRPLSIDGTLDLLVKVTRRDGFDAPIDVTFPLLPPRVDAPSKITIAAGQSEAIYTLRAHPTAEARNWRIVCEARVGVNDGRSGASAAMIGAATNLQPTVDTGAYGGIAVCSRLVELRMEPTPVKGTIGVVAGEQGKTISVICKLEKGDALPSELVASLEGLPNRVHAAEVKLDSNATEIQFQLQLEETAPLGTFDSLTCRLKGTADPNHPSFVVARNSKLQIFEVGELVTDSEGRPLSPVEILRKKQAKSQPQATSSSDQNK